MYLSISVRSLYINFIDSVAFVLLDNYDNVLQRTAMMVCMCLTGKPI